MDNWIDKNDERETPTNSRRLAQGLFNSVYFWHKGKKNTKKIDKVNK